MTNPYQQPHSTPSFAAGDSLTSAGLPPLNVRRPSYASVVSGLPALTRPSRSGFSHLLNPSPDSEQLPHSAGHPYSTAAQNHPHLENAMSYTQLGMSGEDLAARDPLAHGLAAGTAWPPRFGSSYPSFSRAFDFFVNKDPILPVDPAADNVRIPSTSPMPNVSSTGFLAPSYLRGSSYLQELETRHNARLLADLDGNAPKARPQSSSSPVPSRLQTNGSSSHLPAIGTKVAGVAHRGVAYDVVEKPMVVADDDDTISPLPSRWNKDDKEAALEVLGDGFEVRHTGKATSDHEASAIRADHYMSSACGVYYFEISVLNTRSDRIKYVVSVSLVRGGVWLTAVCCPRTPPIAIGFASKEASISRAPGWEADSWGYHGDDGNSFASQNVGKPYSEMFGVGDTVGCLVNFRLSHALFTKNGRELGRFCFLFSCLVLFPCFHAPCPDTQLTKRRNRI